MPQKRTSPTSKAKLAEIKARNEKAYAEALEIATTLRDAWIVLVRQAGESGQLYGSVTAKDVAMGLAEQDISVSGSQIFMEGRIKEIGVHACRIALHPEVIVNVTLNVARSEDAARNQEAEEHKRIKAEEEAAQKAEKKNKSPQKNKKQRKEETPTQTEKETEKETPTSTETSTEES